MFGRQRRPRRAVHVSYALGGLALFAVLVLTFGDAPQCSSPGKPSADAADLSAPAREAAERLEEAAPRLPFIHNDGQWPETIAVRAPVSKGSLTVTTDGELVLRVGGPTGSVVIRESFAPEFGSDRPPRVQGEGRSPTRVSAFIGDDPARWRNNIATSPRVRLTEIAANTDLVLHARPGGVEKAFEVRTGADPGRIRAHVRGADAIDVAPNGDLVLRTREGPVRFTKPVAYQEIGGTRRPVQVAYRVEPDGYGFEIGPYDPSRTLIIDPLINATYVGGSGDDRAYAIALDAEGTGLYIAGETDSLDLPTELDVLRPDIDDRGDLFIAHLPLDLGSFAQVTYFGGSGADFFGGRGGVGGASTLVVNPDNGDVYLAGTTQSGDLPGRSGGAIPDGRGTGIGVLDSDIFVTRLRADLREVLQTTYQLAGGMTRAQALLLHRTRPVDSYSVFVVGDTTGTGLRGIKGEGLHPSLQPQHAGGSAAGGSGWDAFVTRFADHLRNFEQIQSTYLGGSEDDHAWAIAAHPTSGDLFVVGMTRSTSFPGVSGGFDLGHNGYEDAYVARLTFDLDEVVQSTYLGGTDRDNAYAVVVHPDSGHVYVGGETSSTFFPGSNGGAQPGTAGLSNGFVSRFEDDLGAESLIQSTYLTGDGRDDITDLAVHPSSGEVYAIGTTGSFNFPHARDGVIERSLGLGDAYVTRFPETLRNPVLCQSTYLGGSNVEFGHALAIDPGSGDVFAVGLTRSTSTDEYPFPLVDGVSIAQETHLGGVHDGFIARLDRTLQREGEPSNGDADGGVDGGGADAGGGPDAGTGGGGDDGGGGCASLPEGGGAPGLVFLVGLLWVVYRLVCRRGSAGNRGASSNARG